MSSENTLTTLADNALDYILSANEQQEVRSERALKYSILHLFSGVELLLKERLRREHWSLIFQDVKQANKRRLASGDFKSVDFHTCRSRLTEIADVQFTESNLKHLESLRHLRNRLQHYHAEIGQNEVISRLARVNNFVVEFVSIEMPDLNSTHKKQIDEVHSSLALFDEFVSLRTKEIQPKLSSFVSTVWCPRCDQETLGLGNGDPLCPYCGFTDKPFEAMAAAAGDDIIGTCADCGGAMGGYNEFEENEFFVCFFCGKPER